ncbi:MAG: acetyl-CoA acetyltransferase [Pseudomonas sp.]|jgi:acetyl-CoA C-acetyltransferase|nr:3-ketoacyl-CoA thiolase [Stutzerimonas stutzeri TS44]MAF88598.1 acetyl-CoA acetyltransferase [Pseudomonas sp.]MAK87819.1 acetyl-CoA acetyltransferase [Pseudomonas sp.]HCH76526.1 acetyl-CoA C-acetyltransferase [Pseudomonas sp.]|tara:strand:- start:6660 stop:7871 length:1212 start_codon:yes stop_codon:yes gene_type:complete
MRDVYIFDSVRTPRGRGKPGGSLNEISPVFLAAQTLAALSDRYQLDTKAIDDVILGCVTPVGEQGANITRSAILMAGWHESVAGLQVNRWCASGLEAVNLAAAKVAFGETDLVIGGGVESMSRVPMGSDGGSLCADPSVAIPLHFVPQGISADLIATLYGIDRVQADQYAAESHRRAALAQAEGRFSQSIIPIRDVLGQVILAHDENIRASTTFEALGNLTASFSKLGEDMPGFDAVAIRKYPQVEAIHHIHTAGNSSALADGAAAVLLGTAEAGRAHGLTPRARIRGTASIGSEPTIMLTGPEFVTRKALERSRMMASDIDLWELNEAFASIVLRFMQAIDAPHDRLNVNGGAIALGHPLGATGAMILGTLLDEMERRDLETGLATLCVGGGLGTATILERV